MSGRWLTILLGYALPSLWINANAAIDTTPPSNVSAFKQTWLANVLKLQRQIDSHAPLTEASFIGTHNSYNSRSYANAGRYLDPNQIVSVSDQLEMGMRTIEYDAHWTYDQSLTKDILLCHAKDDHIGCSTFDRKMTEGLQELRDWLKANPSELVLFYIERHLDGHEPRLAAQLEEYLGEFIFKPSQVRKNSDNPKSCLPLPARSLTKKDILKSGKQVIIVTKDCARPPFQEQDKFKQNWNDYVFAGIGDIPDRPFSFIDDKMDNFTAPPDCAKSTIFKSDINHSSLWRIFEDRTNLSNMGGPHKKIEDNEIRELTQCATNWIGLDMLNFNDSRLLASVWSWALTYPQEGQGECAIYKRDEGIMNTPCTQTIAGYACQEEKSHQIKAQSLIGPWGNGESACQLMVGKTWHFATPVNGLQLSALKESMASLSLKEVWLNYAANKQGDWVANPAS